MLARDRLGYQIGSWNEANAPPGTTRSLIRSDETLVVRDVVQHRDAQHQVELSAVPEELLAVRVVDEAHAAGCAANRWRSTSRLGRLISVTVTSAPIAATWSVNVP